MIVRSLSESRVEGVTHDPTINKQVLIRDGEVPRLTHLAQAILRPGQRTTAHQHVSMFETYLVESGEGCFLVDGVEAALAAGSCLVVEPGELHHVWNSGTVDLVLTYFGIASEVG